MYFEILWVDVLAGGQDDNVFAATDNIKMAVLVETPEFARAKPSVLCESLFVRLRVTVVAREHDWPPDEHFTDTVFVGFGYLDLGTVHGLTNGTDAIVILVGRCCGSARLGKSVTLRDGKAQLVKVLCDIFVKT